MMIGNRMILWGIAALAALILISMTFFEVDQTQQALVTRFGEVTRQITKPGLNVKWPLIEDVVYFDNRILNLDPPAATLTLADQKRLVIDAFTRWRITDPLTFYKALRSEDQAEARLGQLINGSLLDVLGKVPLSDLLTAKRDDIMQMVRDQVNANVEKLGVKVVDVRIGRADLPAQTLQSVFLRMASERKREAATYRAEGEQKSQEIRAEADAQRTIIISEAEKEAQDTRGDGDKQAIEIYASAAKLDPEFYSFYRSMQAYRTGLEGDNTTLVLSPNSDFFHYFEDAAGRAGKSHDAK
jgi:membrane protease subunit HflC